MKVANVDKVQGLSHKKVGLEDQELGARRYEVARDHLEGALTLTGVAISHMKVSLIDNLRPVFVTKIPGISGKKIARRGREGSSRANDSG